MTEQKLTYDRIINRVTDQLVKYTIEGVIVNEDFFPQIE